MKNLSKIIIALLLVNYGLFSQKNKFVQLVDTSLIEHATADGWIYFKEKPFEAEQLFAKNNKSFRLAAGSTMKVKKTSIGDNGYEHIRYKQYVDNIVVENSNFIIHAQNGLLKTGNGELYDAQNIKKNIVIKEKDALDFAMKYIDAKEYYWQNNAREEKIKKKKKDNKATYFPKAEMVYYFDQKSESLILCYKLILMAIDPGKSATCFIDAENGALIAKKAMETQCDPTTVVTNWYGTRGIATNDVAVVGTSYDLEDDCTASVYGVYDIVGGGGIFNNGSSNSWTTETLRSAATSLWGIKQTYQHYKNVFGRNGHSNSDSDIDIYHGFTWSGGNTDNASYTFDPGGDDEIKVGLGKTISVLDDYNALDIMGHEFTHGVDEYEGELLYERESGALDESFADIFGEWVESSIRNPDWLVGNDRSEGAIRSMIDPNNIGGDPNTYLGTNWVVTTNPGAPDPDANDNWGVHTNSGVQNHMFYLLVNGGSGWNNGLTSHNPLNNGTFWQVGAIGLGNSIRIAYRVLTDYMTSGSTYPVARNAWVRAAVELFGACSYEAIQTGKAWAAVGIQPPLVGVGTDQICNNYGTTSQVITRNAEMNVAGVCTVNILATNNYVGFEARNKISFKNGFRAIGGSNFRALINDDCRFAQY